MNTSIRTVIAAVTSLAILGCLNQREVSGLGPPWRTGVIEAPLTVPQASIGMQEGARLDAIVPLEMFAGFEPVGSIGAARLKHGEPHEVHKEGAGTVYTYRRELADIDIIETEMWGEYSNQSYLGYELRARPRVPLPDVLVQLAEKLTALEPSLYEVFITPQNQKGMLKLYLRRGQIVAIILR
jgi:hypothetical protein